MSENEDGQEKTEQPTAKRLEEAKRKGQTARSKELSTMAVTLLGGILLVGMSGHFGAGLSEIMVSGFSIPRADIFDPSAMARRLVEGIQDALLMLTPFFGLVLVLAIAGSVALGGISLSAQALTPKFGKLNPIKGMGRVFSLKGLLELIKALAKFLLVGGATTLTLWLSLDEFLGLGGMALGPAVAHLGSLVGWSFVLIASTLILIAMVDVPFQLWDHKRQLKMTRGQGPYP